MTTERECIDRISQYVSHYESGGYLIKGIGDDCAVFEKDGDICLLLSTDTLVQGVHFDLDWHPPYLLGRKCASVNVSDIAAMGGQPRTCLLSLGFPGSVPVWFDDFMSGFTTVLNEHGIMLVGGDTVSTRNDFMISVVVTGEGNKKQICYRSGAGPGDLIWVSGFLGNAAAGLEFCRRGQCESAEQEEKWEPLIKAHLDPEAQVELGMILASSGIVRAMIDISDGLATDLAHLCRESCTGAELMQNLLPVSDMIKSAASELDADPLDWILRGGEDYQLLFTTRESDEQKLRKIISDHGVGKVFCIGRIVKDKGVFLCNDDQRQEISYQGYDHFNNV